MEKIGYFKDVVNYNSQLFRYIISSLLDDKVTGGEFENLENVFNIKIQKKLNFVTVQRRKNKGYSGVEIGLNSYLDKNMVEHALIFINLKESNFPVYKIRLY